MALLELSFDSGQDSLSVRHFSVNEALSNLFDVAVVAVSPVDDIDFESIVGKKASFRLAAGTALGRARAWGGVCSHFEQLQAEPNGVSTYLVRIVPELWLLTQRQDNRVFQHATVPEIVRQVLAPWGIDPVLELDAAAHLKQEYRVQYGETDFAFFSRLLEDAGITYRFVHHPERGMRLVLSDKPHSRQPRSGGPIPFVDSPNPEAGRPYLTRVSVAREIKPGAYTIRDHDFRRRAQYELFGRARAAAGVEAQLEQYHYRPGSFVVESQDASAAANEKEGAALAARGLEAERARRERVTFETNLVDLEPGTVFAMSGHPRAHESLLATELHLEGAPGREWTMTGRAVPASAAHRPPRTTPRPKISGVQSAVVVGPAGEDIHTDEHGRVRIQFHWDRQGKFDDKSSCWVRVSQGWAGSGFGMMVLPRVGQEVTVGFFEGDPDQPIVIGRVFNNENRVPYKLPEHKTRSTWRSQSTPGSSDAAYNEIMFEDRREAELVSIHAERDLHKLVKASEIERTMSDRTVSVGRNRTTTVTGVDSTLVGARHAVSIGQGSAGATSLTMTDRRIVCTTGEATVTFDGQNLSLEANGNITIVARDGDVVIKGGPNVKINSD